MYCLQCGHELTRRNLEDKIRPVCPSCGWVLWNDPKVVVAALIHSDFNILLCKRTYDPGKDKWSFPAGYVDRGEKLEDALEREVYEETGLRISNPKLIELWSERGNPVILAVYEVQNVQGKILPNQDEIAAIGWFDARALPDMAFEHDKFIINNWLTKLVKEQE